jgi:hypothetical protein
MNALRNARPKRAEGVTLRRAHDEIMLYDSAADRLHYVNATAAAIWELCDGETDRSEMVAAICLLTGMVPEIVREDVDGVLTKFADAGLVEFVEAPG